MLFHGRNVLMTAVDDCRVVLTEQNRIKDLFTWEREERENTRWLVWNDFERTERLSGGIKVFWVNMVSDDFKFQLMFIHLYSNQTLYTAIAYFYIETTLCTIQYISTLCFLQMCTIRHAQMERNICVMMQSTFSGVVFMSQCNQWSTASSQAYCSPVLRPHSQHTQPAVILESQTTQKQNSDV